MDISRCQVRLQTRFVIQTNVYVLPFKAAEKLSTGIYLSFIFFEILAVKPSFPANK